MFIISLGQYPLIKYVQILEQFACNKFNWRIKFNYIPSENFNNP